MQNFLEKDFEGNAIHAVIWNNRPCWLAKEISTLLGYSNTSTLIKYCALTNELELELDYDILRNDKLKEFKAFLKNTELSQLKLHCKTRNIIILYEDALFALLQSSQKPLAKKFRKWLRTSFLPFIRDYSSPNSNNEISNLKIFDDSSDEKLFSHIDSSGENFFSQLPSDEKISSQLKYVAKNIELIDKMLGNSLTNQEKRTIINKMYSLLGINLNLDKPQK